ncbi:glycosyl transferase [Enterobacter hormaechei]|nr:glycosyl transferase [Enterobacter hormaechei]
MSYVFLLILLFPVKLIRKLFRKDTGKNLVIQTAKIGDFINATPLLAWLQKSDVLISRSVGALAKHDETIEQIYFIEQHKRNLWRKLCFACRIMNRYDNVYLLQPNSVNLFFAAVCNAKNKQFLSIYTRRWYHGIFYLAADGTVEHGKKTLSVTNYLKLADRSRSHGKTLPSTPQSRSSSRRPGRLFLINLTLSASASVLRQAIKPKPSLRLSGSGLLINSLIYPASFMSSARQTNSRGWMISPAFTVKSLILLILLAKFR